MGTTTPVAPTIHIGGYISSDAVDLLETAFQQTPDTPKILLE